MLTRPVRAAQSRTWSIGWRVAVSCLGLVALPTGSLQLSDEAWPFGPM